MNVRIVVEEEKVMRELKTEKSDKYNNNKKNTPGMQRINRIVRVGV